ncbi:hypothetical protein CDAR_184801 [Caerostris darwini]|uniref:Uncharacterized protein n=1 Tax=Caerostris darwini TaxID=1538125 RepID=A0AAV4SQ98_9ARAC|nr:hypothetical protein CDAR_184801 [Caerostris darwini]
MTENEPLLSSSFILFIKPDPCFSCRTHPAQKEQNDAPPPKGGWVGWAKMNGDRVSAHPTSNDGGIPPCHSSRSKRTGDDGLPAKERIPMKGVMTTPPYLEGKGWKKS